jgi:RNA recognition motif-containing protein
MEVRLYVGNLPYATTEKELRLLFAQAGNVTSVALIQDRQLGRSKGFAFVTMGTQAEAQRAIGMFSAFALADRELNVKLAKTREVQGSHSSRRSASTSPNGRKDGRKPVEPGSGYQSRLSAFGPADRKVTMREPSRPQGGYQSQLSAFGSGNTLRGPRLRGRRKRD